MNDAILRPGPDPGGAQRTAVTPYVSMPSRPPRCASYGWSAVALRAIVGCGFLAHGIAKVSRGPGAFAEILNALGMPFPHVAAWATILVEIVGGLSVLAGAFVWAVATPMAAVLLVAMFTVHLPYGFSSIKLVAVTPAGAQFGPPGYEVDLLYLASLVALIAGGTGPFAIDGLLRRTAPRCPRSRHWTEASRGSRRCFSSTLGSSPRLRAADASASSVTATDRDGPLTR